MIGYISGEVVSIGTDNIIVSTNGVGYTVYVSPTVIGETSEGDNIDLWIHTAVREDALDLYGFKTQQGRDFFQHLIGVSGIGPKTGLGILSLAPAEKIVSAITAEDTSYLTNVSGVGKKSAEKIVLELKDKLDDFDLSESEGSHTQQSEVMNGLVSMGYSTKEAREAIAEIDDDIEETSEQIRAALKMLG